MKLNLSDNKLRIYIGAKIALFCLTMVSCGNNNMVQPLPNTAANTYPANYPNTYGSIDGNWRMVSMTCNGMPVGQGFYSGTGTTVLNLTQATGTLTMTQVSTSNCAASTQLSVSNVNGQVVFRSTNGNLTYNPANCSFPATANVNAFDFFQDIQRGDNFTVNSMANGVNPYGTYPNGTNPYYNTYPYGTNPYGTNPYGMNTNGVSNTLTLTSTVPYACSNGGSGVRVVTFAKQ